MSQTKVFYLTFIFIATISIASSTGPIECQPKPGQEVSTHCERLKRLLNASNMGTVLGYEDAQVKNIKSGFQRTTYIGNFYTIKAIVLVQGEEKQCCLSAFQKPWTNLNAKLKVTCGQCGACTCFKDDEI